VIALEDLERAVRLDRPFVAEHLETVRSRFIPDEE
jgi:hypothetical protein